MKTSKFRVKVLIADDHPVVLDGIRRAFEDQPGFEIVAQAQNGVEAVAQASLHRPDVIIMDVSMPQLNGIEATARILAEQPRAKIVALSVHARPTMIHAMLKAGARGYLAKNSLSSELVDAIRAVMADRIYLGRSIAGQMHGDTGIEEPFPMPELPADATASRPCLTTADRETLQLMAQDLSTKEMAARLNITRRGVEARRVRLKKKLNIKSLVGLAKYALREGFLPNP